MKKIFIVFTIALFVISFGLSRVHAQNADMQSEPKVLVQSEYILPYPGILSDHPLYFLKKFRDGILEKIISDPVKKLEFYILQSDKELNAAIFLTSQGKNIHVSSAIIRSVQFKEKAVIAFKALRSESKEIPEYILERVLHSLQKQLEVQGDLIKNSKTPEVQLDISSKSQRITQLKADVDMLK